MKKAAVIALLTSALLLTACQGTDIPQTPANPASPTQTETQEPEQAGTATEPEQEAIEAEPIHTLGEYIEIDVENVSHFEHAVVHEGPSVVEYVTEFSQQEAIDMARQLSQLAVIGEGNIYGQMGVGGSAIRYTLNFSNGAEPLVIYYCNTFTEGKRYDPPVCYINRDHYPEVTSPDRVDIIFPEDAKSVMYDIVNGQRVERTY